MSLMDAKEYDPRPAQRRKRLIGLSVLLVIMLTVVWFWPSGRVRYASEWNIADSFFTAIEHRDFERAYGLYNDDPEWKAHPTKYQQYSFAQFMSDWGPAGDLGQIKTHDISCALEPPTSGFSPSTGVVVVAKVNGRSDTTLLWIEKKTDTISVSPWDLVFLTRHAPLARAYCYRAT